MMMVKIKKVGYGLNMPLPSRATDGSSGYDLYAAIDTDRVLRPMSSLLIPTGISIAVPATWEAQIRSRSGLAARHSVVVLNSPGTIDSDYRGEVAVLLHNHDQMTRFLIEPGMRIAQMVFSLVQRVDWDVVDELPEAISRGCGGFGSTGE